MIKDTLRSIISKNLKMELCAPERIGFERRSVMTKPENGKSADQMGQVKHPERHYNSQRNKIRDQHDTEKRPNKQDDKK